MPYLQEVFGDYSFPPSPQPKVSLMVFAVSARSLLSLLSAPGVYTKRLNSWIGLSIVATLKQQVGAAHSFIIASVSRLHVLLLPWFCKLTSYILYTLPIRRKIFTLFVPT